MMEYCAKCPDFQPVQAPFQVGPRSRPASLRRDVEVGGPCLCVCRGWGPTGVHTRVCRLVGQQESTVCVCVCVYVRFSETFSVGFGESVGVGIGY